MPDAEALIGISKLLEVPVSKLLGAEVEQTDMEDLTEELARVNEQLAGLHRKEDRMKTGGGEARLDLVFIICRDVSFACDQAGGGITFLIRSMYFDGCCDPVP